ncbi:MAG TPA: tyrosinase family protein [Frankiaceae bacterium]|nr:tyrosinase family protein [Frankiaceae bacterium]
MNGPYVRRDIYSLDPDDPIVVGYANAVATMKQRDTVPTDVTSWAYQAGIHGSYAPPQALWNTCEHGSWFFTPWHRMYLRWFEEIVRAAVVLNNGPEDWALPYWNYTATDGGNPVLPPAFRDPGSPLYVAQRRTTPFDVNGGDPIPAGATLIDATLQVPTFVPPDGAPPSAGFGGQRSAPIHFGRGFGALELQPHNVMHNAIGGFGGLMTDPNTAAQDPIFWLHHANIDRLWASWNAAGRGNPTNDGLWAAQDFSFFSADGGQQAMPCGKVNDTMDYTYDRLSPVPPPTGPTSPSGPAGPQASALTEDAPHAELVGASRESVTLTGRRTAGSVGIDRRASDLVQAGLGDEEDAGPRRVLLSLDDIEAEQNPGTVYGVYVNLPDGATEDQAEEHLAGALSFFGIEQVTESTTDGEHGHSYSAGFDITELVGRLSARGAWDGSNVDVTFHPLGVPQGDDSLEAEGLPEVTVGRISVHYV